MFIQSCPNIPKQVTVWSPEEVDGVNSFLAQIKQLSLFRLLNTFQVNLQKWSGIFTDT